MVGFGMFFNIAEPCFHSFEEQKVPFSNSTLASQMSTCRPSDAGPFSDTLPWPQKHFGSSGEWQPWFTGNDLGAYIVTALKATIQLERKKKPEGAGGRGRPRTANESSRDKIYGRKPRNPIVSPTVYQTLLRTSSSSDHLIVGPIQWVCIIISI